MGLPREIRDQIYLAVLQTPAPPPASPEDTGPQTGKMYALELDEDSSMVLYPMSPKFKRYASQNLLGCNHQINGEVREVLARHDKPGSRALDFKLDVMVHRGAILPTWALVPGPVAHARDLEIDVRMLGRCYKDVLSHDFGRRGILKMLLDLLTCLFQYGLASFGKVPTANGLHVETVTFTICWSKWPETLPHEEPAVHRRPCSGSSLRYRLVKLVISQGEPWRISQILLNNDKEVEELSARDRELARKILTCWYGHEEH